MMKLVIPLSLLAMASGQGGGGLRSSSNLRKLTSKAGIDHTEYYSPQHKTLLDDISSPPLLYSTGEIENDYLTPDVDYPRRLQEYLSELVWEPETKAGEPPLPAFKEENEVEPKSKQPPWPHELSDIPLDPAITYGELDNGMRYYARPNSEPPGQLELRLHIDAGANFESDAERGLAHFLEHMMFQTTESYPEEGTLIPAFQRLGVGFGAHLNAYTNLEETVYSLALPNVDPETLDMGMGWMKDVMGGALLEETEIEAERGVIVSELQLRESVGRRISKELYNWLMPDTLLVERFNVGGTEQTVMTQTQDMFQQFYDKYYIPRRATFIIVGDLNATDMVAMIEETFGDLEDSGTRGEEADYGSVPEGTGLRTRVMVDDEIPSAQISMNTVRNIEFVPDTEETRAEAMMNYIGNSILRSRLNELGSNATSAIRSGSASNSNLYEFAYMSSITAVPKDGQWRPAVAVIEQEWRRIMEHGFTPYEIEEAKARRLNAYTQNVATQSSRSSSGLADTLNRGVNGGYVVTAPEESLRIAVEILEGVTPEAVHEAFRSMWNTTDINVYLVTNNDDINGTVEEVTEELGELFVASQDVPVDPPEEEEAVVWAYTDFGPAGTVVSDSFVEDLEIRQLVLSNNVRVNMKQTDFQTGGVSFRARFGNGQLGQPKTAFLDDFADYMLSNGALGEHTVFDIGNALAGKSVDFGFSIAAGDFIASGGSSSDNLELALQLMTAHFTDPAFREEAVGWWRNAIPSYIESVKHSLGGAYSYGLFAWLLGNDERFGAPTEEDLLAFVASDASDWLVPYLNNSYLEFSIIGDFNETEALDMILRTVGALAEREDAPAEISEAERAIDLPEPQTNSWTYETKLPKAGAWVAWEIPSYVDEDVELSRQLGILSAVFRDRMRVKIREELAGSYSPGAGTSQSSVFDYGFFIASAQGLPEEVVVFTDIILGIAANITTGDITQDEFVRAVIPKQSGLDDSLRDNGYWMGVMDQSQARPHHLDWARGRDEFYAAMTVDEINALAMQYLSPDAAYPLSIIPVNATDASLGGVLEVDRGSP